MVLDCEYLNILTPPTLHSTQTLSYVSLRATLLFSIVIAFITFGIEVEYFWVCYHYFYSNVFDVLSMYRNNAGVLEKLSFFG